MSARELRTAEILVAMFEAQIRAHDEHWSMGRARRRRAIKSGLYDITIDARIDQLRAGHEKWAARVAELREEAHREDTSADG